MNIERIKKLERVSRELISTFIFEELEDYENTFGIITITGIKISSDLSYLDIFISSLLNGDVLAKTLAKHNVEIQKRLHKALCVRKLPKIRYRYDESGAIGEEVCNLINKIT